MPTNEKINGSMFMLLNKFVESNYDHQTWINLTKAAGAEKSHYNMEENYPMSEMEAIISQASDLTGLSENDLKEKFGEFLVPNLLNIYKKYVNPSWKTFEMLQYTEKIMHQAVRKENQKANPPALHVTKVGDHLIIDYHSKRKMAALAVGIIKGIADYYNERDKVEVIPMTNLNDERVQIKVNFKK